MSAKRVRRNGRAGPALAAVILVVGVAACTAPTPQAATVTPVAQAVPAVTGTTTERATSPQAAITERTLQNGTYELPDLGQFSLVDGNYEHSYGSGATQKDMVAFQAGAIGDLNADGVPDAAVVLASVPGGSGSFFYLVAGINDGGALRQVGSELLGDRVQIESLAIDAGRIIVHMVVAGPNDPQCCPSQKVTRTYAVVAAAMQLLSEEKG